MEAKRARKHMRAKREKVRAAQTTPQAFDVPQFCAAHSISRSLFYLMQRNGRGPRTFKAGRRTLVSREAAEEWRARMEGETTA